MCIKNGSKTSVKPPVTKSVSSIRAEYQAQRAATPVTAADIAHAEVLELQKKLRMARAVRSFLDLMGTLDEDEVQAVLGTAQRLKEEAALKEANNRSKYDRYLDGDQTVAAIDLDESAPANVGTW